MEPLKDPPPAALRPLSEMTAFSVGVEAPATRLLRAFLRALQQRNLGLTLEDRDDCVGKTIPGGPWLHANRSAALLLEHYFFEQGSDPSMTDLQSLLPVLVRLLLAQYPAHKKTHANVPLQQQLQQQLSEDSWLAPSPTEGAQDLTRLGNASSLSDSSPEGLYRFQEGDFLSSTAVSSEGDWGKAFPQVPPQGPPEGGEALNCLWCVARGSLDDKAMLTVQAERLKWICQLRFAPSISCFLFPRWLWGGPRRVQEQRRHGEGQTDRGPFLLCA